ncbi:Protein of unknown function [Bacillus wiedmannii]|nr:Protein of unknown function [Bacillus wiedmannii]
MGVELLI